MDPNANITEQVELARSLIFRSDEYGTVDEIDALRLAELVVSLDEWLTRRGAPPRRWVPSPLRAGTFVESDETPF